MSVLSFLSSTAGRWTRGSAGVALIAIGGALGGAWWLLALPGLLFIAVGALDVCLIAPLVGKPLRGADFRASVGL